MRIQLSKMPPEFDKVRNLRKLVDGKVFMCAEVRGRMRELPQVGHLAHEDLVKHLSVFGCSTVKFTPGLWKRENNEMSFTLVAEGFGKKLFNIYNSLILLMP